MTTMRKETRAKGRRVKKKVAPVAPDARETAVRYAEATRDWAAPKAGAAKEWAAPRVEPAVVKVKEDVLPKVAGAVTAALVASEPAREEAKTRGTAAFAALRGEVEPPKPKKHRVRKLFLLAGVMGGAYAGWRAWTAQSRSSEPEPWVTPLPEGSNGLGSVTHPVTDDVAGASPDEALADAAEEDTVAKETAEIPPATTEKVTPRQSKRAKDEEAKARKTT